MHRLPVFALLLLISFGALAQSDNESEMRRLSALLDAIRQEQQSVYQQFQMTEALQRSEALYANGPAPGMDVQDGRAPNYDDAVKARQEREARQARYLEDMRRLAARYKELGQQSTAVVEQMRALSPSNGSR